MKTILLTTLLVLGVMTMANSEATHGRLMKLGDELAAAEQRFAEHLATNVELSQARQALQSAKLKLEKIMGGKRREADTHFLLAWIGLFFAGALVLFFAGSARYLLPMAAPVAGRPPTRAEVPAPTPAPIRPPVTARLP